MIEKQMLRLMLNKTFYTKYKGSISPTIFSGDISSLFETIQKAHAKYSDNISVDELYSLHTAIFNPALTRAAKEKFSELVEDIKEVQEPSKEIAKDIMSILSNRDLAQRIAVEATEIFNGKDANFTEITSMIENHKQESENFLERCIKLKLNNDTKKIISNPSHPYTQGLIDSIPSNQKKGEKLYVIEESKKKW